MTLQAALVDAAREHPNHPWICCDDEVWTYAEGDRITDRLARGLIGAGVAPGDRVALLFENSPELVIAYYACFKIGAIAAPLNTRFQGPELVYALTHCDAKLLIGQDHLCAAVLARRAEIPRLAAVYVTGQASPEDGARAFAALLGDNGDAPPLPSVDGGQVAIVMYTSGTTAKPKGVIHTHAGLLAQARNFFDALGEAVFERTVISVPLCHISGFGALMLPTTQAAGTQWIIRRFDPERVLRTLQHSRATYSGGLPVQINMLVNCPGAETFDLSALKLYICGGDCVPAELQNRFQTLFGVPLDEICGMTEIYYAIQPLAAGERRPGSIGKPMGDVRIVLEDETGAAVPDGAVGEIVAYSAGATPGYWNDPQSTAATLRDGGLHTGDLGPARLGRLLLVRGAQQGHHHPRRLQHRPGRGGGCTLRPSRGL